MKSTKQVLLSLAVLSLAGFVCAGGLVVDHTKTTLSQIPVFWINQAKADLKIAYQHTSHGSQLSTGIDAISRVVGAPYTYTSTGGGYNVGVFLNDYGINGAGDLGGDWATATRNLLSRAGGCDRNVVMWSWCGQADTSAANITTYLSLMNQLELDFPQVTFVYMTGHLVGTGAAGNLNLRNEQIRTFCRTNHKILFDFADIESYQPNGTTNFMALNCNDNCDYTGGGGGNWASQWLAVPANATTQLGQIANSAQCGGCAHSQKLNCVLKGQAFWWLMARIAGWDGTDETTSANGFYSLTPCRALDTRESSGSTAAAPILAPWERRYFPVKGKCGVPYDAIAVSANVTVVGATAAGDLKVVSGAFLSTKTTTISFGIGRARANNLSVELSDDEVEGITIINNSPGSVHVVFDVNGYFR